MTPKDKAPHTLGRVVVNFQRLEHNLKILSNVAPIERRREKSSRITVGAAINSWIDVLNGNAQPADRTADLFPITVNHQIMLNPDSVVQEAHATGQKALLEERNTVIHGGLVDFPCDSEPDCQELIVYLDSLNSATCERMHFLEPIAESLRELKSDALVLEQGESEREYREYVVPAGDA